MNMLCLKKFNNVCFCLKKFTYRFIVFSIIHQGFGDLISINQ